MGSQQYALYTSPPRKDGRFRGYFRQRRRTAAIRLIAVLLVTAILYTFLGLPLHLPQTRQDEEPPIKEIKRTHSPPPGFPLPAVTNEARPSVSKKVTSLTATATSGYDEPEPQETFGLNRLAQSEALKVQPSEQPEFKNGNDPRFQATVKSPGDSRSQAKLKNEHDSKEFVAALLHVFSLHPDEMHMKQLLSPYEGTGKEKLRDVGLRARAYKRYFEAWEALHLVFEGNTTYVRDDIVHYLRSQHESRSLPSSLEPLAQTIRDYEAYRYFLSRLAALLFPWTAPYFSDHMSLHAHIHRGGRGMVLSAGDDQAPYLFTQIETFRRLGCTLPIEVMYLGDKDLGEDYRAELELLPGVITRDMSQMVSDNGWKLAGWAAKPFAILMSSFREVIFVDADSFFFHDPETLFEDTSYIDTGALFFKDRLIVPESKKNWLQQILQKPISKQVRKSRLWTGVSGHMQESGVLVVDKWRHLVAMLMVTRMNGPDRDGNKDEDRIGVYDMLYGDKETFWLGWELVGDLEYAWHAGPAGIMGEIAPLDWDKRDWGKQDKQDDDGAKSGRKKGDTEKKDTEKKDTEKEDTEEADTDKDGNDKDGKEEVDTDKDSEEKEDKEKDHKQEDSKKTAQEGGRTADGNKQQKKSRKKDDKDTAQKEEKPQKRKRSDANLDKAARDLASQTTPKEFTICAPQLLHLTANGKPLWFNGGLISNKFVDKKKRKGSVFEAYLAEPTAEKGEDIDPWKMKEANICCLTSDKMSTFSEEEKETLKMIISVAKEYGAYGAKS